MKIDRREFLARAAGAVAVSMAIPGRIARAEDRPRAKIRVGACVVGLDQAKAAGLDGVEVWAGGAADVLDIAKPETRARYKEQMQRTGLPICSLMMGLLNTHPLASDPRGPAWLEQSIDAAKDLGAKNILVAFFGQGDLLAGDDLKKADVDVVVDRLKAAAPRAKDAGVILAIENLCSAGQNAQILERIGSEAVRIYYDVYNTGRSRGYDVPAELRMLKDRVSQIHFKNGDQYLEADRGFFEKIATAIKDIRYEGWIVLETSSPSKDGVADAKKNGDFVRSLFA